MSPFPYAPPLDRILTLGDPRPRAEWADYQQLGLTREHVPDLVRMCMDETLRGADSGSAEVWAPLHAWRALGQMRAVEAIEPLIGLLRLIDEEDDDWISSDFPEVFGMIGPAMIPFLDLYLNDEENGLLARVCAAISLEKIGNAHPEAREACVEALTVHLRKCAENDPSLNAFLISSLVDLKAVESVETIRMAYDADDVDESVLGDMEDVEIHLGLREKRSAPVRKRRWETFSPMKMAWEDEEEDEEENFEEDAEWLPPQPEEERLGAGEYVSDGFNPYRRAGPKIGRNDPCPCGSGKKYKKCCLNKL